MTRTEMLQELRETLDDTGFDPLWSDARLLRFLTEGQDKFCEETGFFIDIEAFQIQTAAGQERYELDDRIIEVLEVWDGAFRLGNYGQTDKVSEVLSPGTGVEFPLPNQDAYAWQADEQTGFITLYPKPVTAKTLTLRCWRYPMKPLNNKDEGGLYDAEPEIPKRFHRACVEYAAFLALMVHDAEKQDKVKAKDHLDLFTNLYVPDGRKAFNRSRVVRTSLGGNPLYVV